jgi:hypothetical protein
VAGDPEKCHMETCDKRGGIPYHPSQIKYGASFYCATYIPLHVELEIIGSYWLIQSDQVQLCWPNNKMYSWQQGMISHYQPTDLCMSCLESCTNDPPQMYYY